MQRSSSGIGIFETLLSTVVILVAAGFLAFVLWQTGSHSLRSYELAARIESANGLKPGTDVKIAGVTVGSVESLDLTQTGKRYGVAMKLAIREGIGIPQDSRFSIGGGTLSSTALTIEPGRSKIMVPPGGTLKGR